MATYQGINLTNGSTLYKSKFQLAQESYFKVRSLSQHQTGVIYKGTFRLGFLNSGGDFVTTVTYYHRAWDSNGNFVYWQSTNNPDFNPINTNPPTVGTLISKRIIGKNI